MPDSCPNCGASLADDAIFCHRCGRNFTVEMAAAQQPTAPARVQAAPSNATEAEEHASQEQPASDTLARLRGALGDRYAVERELGRGGMATVFLAKDLKHEREVAIKVLHPDLSASVGAERFEREIRLAAKLQHPNILGLYDSGSADGLLYYVMPFVKGESLRDRIDREKMLPVEDAVGITLQVADALGYAHAQGIVHRDIKPENILLSGGHALVADFGIARAVSDTGGERKLTQTGMSMGTPYYMAPEQASGEAVGPAADIYSLGCMLYEMLAGEPPFTGKNSMQIMARHAMEQVPSIRIVRNAVPEEVEDRRSSRRSGRCRPTGRRPRGSSPKSWECPSGRPRACARCDVGGVDAAHPDRARGMAAFAAGAPLWRRPMLLAVAALVAVAGAAGIWRWKDGASHSAIDTGPEAHRIAVLYFDDLSKDHSLGPLADGLTEGLIRSLSGASSFTVISSAGVGRYRGTSVGRRQHRARAPRELSRAGELEPEGDKVRVGVAARFCERREPEHSA